MGSAQIDMDNLDIKGYNYLRLTYVDMAGTVRCKIIPRKHIESVLKQGTAMYEGAMLMGLKGEIDPELHKRLFDEGCPNMVMMPDLRTIYGVPWSGPRNTVGQVICNLIDKEGYPVALNPRHLAEKQIGRLDKLGLFLYSTFEPEVTFLNAETREPIYDELDYCSSNCVNQHDEMLQNICSMMKDAGVDIECIHSEYSPGQFEFNFNPVRQIESADVFIRFKQGLKELCFNQGKIASFLAKPQTKIGCGNGAHFNFSLWDKETRNNVFFDSSQPRNMSELMRHFLGGLIEHANALTALCAADVNSYRRLHLPWAADLNNWGVEDRLTTFRLKLDSESGTLIENRIPGASCHPYLVVAATLAAGLDGVERNLEPPEPRQSDAPKLPVTLTEALNELENDQVMIDSLGREFIEYFVKQKKKLDLVHLKHVDVLDAQDIQGLNDEIKYYERKL